MLCHYKRKEESPDCTLLRFGDSFCVLMELSYLFAYRHYSICKNFFQYAFGNLKTILIWYQSTIITAFKTAAREYIIPMSLLYTFLSILSPDSDVSFFFVFALIFYIFYNIPTVFCRYHSESFSVSDKIHCFHML